MSQELKGLLQTWLIWSSLFPGGISGKEPGLTANAVEEREERFDPWVRKIPWRRAWEPTPGSIHAWRIPWTEKSGRLQSTGSQRVRHDWSDLARMHELYEESNSASFLKMRKLKIGKVKYPFEDHTRSQAIWETIDISLRVPNFKICGHF